MINPLNLRKSLAVTLLTAPFLLAMSAGRLLAQTPAPTVFGYTDFSAESKIEQKFLAVPAAKCAPEDAKREVKAVPLIVATAGLQSIASVLNVHLTCPHQPLARLGEDPHRHLVFPIGHFGFLRSPGGTSSLIADPAAV